MIADLSGRTAFVTGCLGGIGRATCAALAEAGTRVIGTDIAADAGDWNGDGGAAYRQLDVRSGAAGKILRRGSKPSPASSTSWSIMPASRWSIGSRTRAARIGTA